MERYELTPRGWEVVDGLRAREFQRAAGIDVVVRVAAELELEPEIPEPAEPEEVTKPAPPIFSPFKTFEGYVKKESPKMEVYLLALANLQDRGISPTLVEWGKEVARMKNVACPACKGKADPDCPKCQGTGVGSVSGPGVGQQAALLMKLGLVKRLGKTQRSIDITESGRSELAEISRGRGHLEAYMDVPSILSYLIEEGKITGQDIVDAAGELDPEAKNKLINLLRRSMSE